MAWRSGGRDRWAVMETIASPAAWAAFVVGVLGMLALDLGVFHRRSHVVGFRESMTWSVIWILLSTAFGVLVWRWLGPVKGLEYATGYVLEKALSIDNLFIMLVVLQAFRVPEEQRHRVLFWGVLGALVLRAVFIFLGAALIAQFHWVLYGFGALLLVTGVRMLRGSESKSDPKQGLLVRALRRVMPVSDVFHGAAFFVRQAGRWVATPLLVALVAIEGADLVFAVDSIPAVFAVTTDPFIVFTSNVMAILGLRSLFFALAGALERFHLLKYGLGGVLLFVGAKMVLVDLVHVPAAVSLLVIGGILAAAVLASLWTRRGDGMEPPVASTTGDHERLPVGPEAEVLPQEDRRRLQALRE